MKLIKNTLNKIEANFNKVIEQQGLVDPRNLKKTVMPSLQKHLDKEKSKIEHKAMLDAEDLAKRDIPRREGDKLAPYIQYITEAVSLLCNKVSTELQAESLPRLKENAKTLAGTEIEELSKQQEELKNMQVNKTRDMRSLLNRDVYNWIKLPFLLVFIGVCLLGDVLYNSRSLQAFSISHLESMIIIVPLVAGLAIIGHYFFKELRKDDTQRRSIFKLILLGFGILSLFAVLGYVRVGYLNEVTQSIISPAFGTLMFVVINVLIFTGISAAFFSFPTEEQTSIRRNANKARAELKEIEDKLDDISEEIKILKRWLNETQTRADEIMDYHNLLLNENLAFYRSVCSNWKRELITRLRHTPSCLDQPLPRVTCRFVSIDNLKSH